ncbi:hypothetical protein ACTMTU_04560 [Streptomyces sp. OZ13]|uniref:hypothetical protein n=1 Tax=Streptomyces sp. OZ13 TaxID=3452210 RepID=UPI003F8AD319
MGGEVPESAWGPDEELASFVCERYARAGHPADVVTVRRDLLRARLSLAAYQQVRTAARAAGGSVLVDAHEGVALVDEPGSLS